MIVTLSDFNFKLARQITNLMKGSLELSAGVLSPMNCWTGRNKSLLLLVRAMFHNETVLMTIERKQTHPGKK